MIAQVYALDFSQDAVAAAFAGGGSGQFAWPEQVRVFTQGFGCTTLRLAPNSSECPTGHFHPGLDIAGPNLVDVEAADTGIARVFIGTTGYGNYVIITHGNGYSTLYGHLHDFVVKGRPAGPARRPHRARGHDRELDRPARALRDPAVGQLPRPLPFLEGCMGY